MDDVSLVRGVLSLDTSFTYNMSYDLVQLPVLAEAARKSLIFSIHNNTQLNVSIGAGILDLARVQLKSITRGSVIIQMSFLAPEGTTAGQLDALGTAIHQQPEAYMAGPFTASFGPSVILSASAATALPGSWLTASSWGGIFAGCFVMLLLVPPIGFGIYLLWGMAVPRIFFCVVAPAKTYIVKHVALPLATAFRPVTLWIHKVVGPYCPRIHVAYIRVVNGIVHARRITWWSDAMLPLRFIVTKHWNDYPVGHHRYDPDDIERRATCGFSWPARHIPTQYYFPTHQEERHMMPVPEQSLEGLVDIQPSSSVPHSGTAAPPASVPSITITSPVPARRVTSPSSPPAVPYGLCNESPRASAKPLPVLMRTSQCGSQDPVREFHSIQGHSIQGHSIQGTSQGIIQATRRSTEEQCQAETPAIEPRRAQPDNRMQWVEKLPVEQPMPEIMPVGGEGTIAYISTRHADY